MIASNRWVEAGDSTVGPVQATGWPGSFKGGASKDLQWIGTSYGPSALHEVGASKTTPLLVPEATVREAERIAREYAPAVDVAPFRPHLVGMVVSEQLDEVEHGVHVVELAVSRRADAVLGLLNSPGLGDLAGHLRSR